MIPKKSKSGVNAEEDYNGFWNKRHYPIEFIWSAKNGGMSEDDKAFILLLYVGCNAVMAYRVAYRPNASAHSIATMASRLKSEQWVQDAFRNLRRYKAERGYFDFREWI